MKVATETKPSENQKAGYSKKQLFKRFTVKLMSLVSLNEKSYAGFVHNEKNYVGFIHNVSEEGLAFEIYDFEPMLKELSPKRIIKLTVRIPSGEMLNLNCEIVWSSIDSHSRLLQNYTTHKMGMRIIDPPSKYREYVKSLK
jgi:hypothetical protein